MGWDKPHVQTMIGMMGYTQDTRNDHIWKQTINGKDYCVDFKKEEIFVFIGTDRITDLNDETFQALKTAVEYASVESPERREDQEKPSTTKEIPETPASIPETPKQDKPVETPKPAPEQPQKENKPTKSSLLGLARKYTGDDILEIFGDTGSGKSKFAMEIAREAIAEGKKVCYIDSERNLTQDDIASLKGCQYQYLPALDQVANAVRKLPTVDVVILDSIGFPVLTEYADLTMNTRGDALLKMIAILGKLKKWTCDNKAIAIVVNQPESEFNKKPGHILRPFGDKSQFCAKEIWKSEKDSSNEKETIIVIKSFRSRSVGYGAKIVGMKITGAGVEVV